MGNTKICRIIFASALFTWGCGGGGGGNPGTGGSSATGGTGNNGTGGASTGGSGPGTGGANSTGGTTGTGGTHGTGGTVGTGGSATGGNGSGTGGNGGSGTGTGGSAGGGGGKGGMAGSGSGTGGSAGSSAGGNGGTSSSTAVTVQLTQTDQTIAGFGLNTALSSATPPWDTFYGTSGSGLGLSIVRVAMQSDGSLSGVLPPSSYNATVIASPWTAPGNYKLNHNSTQMGGHLDPNHYSDWATAIANFASKNHITIMAAANEPDFASCGQSIGPPCNGDYDSMVYTANEMVNFIKVLGPKLHALSPSVKLLAPEPSEWLHLWSNMSATGSTVSSHPNSSDPLGCGCFGNDPGTTGCASTCAQGNGYDYGHFLAADATAWGLVDIIGTHEYDTQKAAPWPADVTGGKRSKDVWETEVSGVMYWPQQGPSSDISNGIAVAQWIHSALVVGEASAWLYWWYQASGSDDNEGLVLKGSSTLTKRCYTLGNYSKFVRPNYVRVNVTGNVPSGVLLSAFTNPMDGTVVVVAINTNSAAATVPISIAGGTAPAMMTPNVTSSSQNLVAGTAVAVSGGSFTAMLGAQSVTTFVGK